MARSIVEISGHIIDSLILPKILDLIVNLGAEFEILDIQIGHRAPTAVMRGSRLKRPARSCSQRS